MRHISPPGLVSAKRKQWDSNPQAAKRPLVFETRPSGQSDYFQFSYSGDGRIRTHKPLLTTCFQDKSLMPPGSSPILLLPATAAFAFSRYPLLYQFPLSIGHWKGANIALLTTNGAARNTLLGVSSHRLPMLLSLTHKYPHFSDNH